MREARGAPRGSSRTARARARYPRTARLRRQRSTRRCALRAPSNVVKWYKHERTNATMPPSSSTHHVMFATVRWQRCFYRQRSRYSDSAAGKRYARCKRCRATRNAQLSTVAVCGACCHLHTLLSAMFVPPRQRCRLPACPSMANAHAQQRATRTNATFAQQRTQRTNERMYEPTRSSRHAIRLSV